MIFRILVSLNQREGRGHVSRNSEKFDGSEQHPSPHTRSYAWLPSASRENALF
jgi:hypothetical protein